MRYKVKIEATNRATGQPQSCDRTIEADHQQAAESMGLQLLGVNPRDWAIHQLLATPQTEQRATSKQK